MPNEIIVALITGGLALIGTIISNSLNHSKTMYRIDELEKKVEKHNNLVERMYIAEKKIEILDEKQKVCNHRLDDLERKEE